MALSPSSVVALVSAALALALAPVVYAVGPKRSSNRILAVLLSIEASLMVASAALAHAELAHPDRVGVGGIILACLAATLPLYLSLVRTLRTPVVVWLRRREVFASIITTAAILCVWVLVRLPRDFLRPGPDPATYSLFAAVIAVSVFGLVASTSAFARAPRGSMARRQARAFLLAFGVRDVIFAVTLGAELAESSAGLDLSPLLLPFGVYILYLAPLLFVPLLVYGILQSQLFDIDLRIKWTIRRGTLVAAFLGVFVLVARMAEAYLEGALGWVAGGAAAALMLFALRPLERVADRVANAAMPGTTGSREYLAFRRLEVYKAAVEAAHENGGISEKEREGLRRLREKLGIADADAKAVEGDVLAS